MKERGDTRGSRVSLMILACRCGDRASPILEFGRWKRGKDRWTVGQSSVKRRGWSFRETSFTQQVCPELKERRKESENKIRRQEGGNETHQDLTHHHNSQGGNGMGGVEDNPKERWDSCGLAGLAHELRARVYVSFSGTVWWWWILIQIRQKRCWASRAKVTSICVLR